MVGNEHCDKRSALRPRVFPFRAPSLPRSLAPSRQPALLARSVRGGGADQRGAQHGGALDDQGAAGGGPKGERRGEQPDGGGGRRGGEEGGDRDLRVAHEIGEAVVAAIVPHCVCVCVRARAHARA